MLADFFFKQQMFYYHKNFVPMEPLCDSIFKDEPDIMFFLYPI